MCLFKFVADAHQNIGIVLLRAAKSVRGVWYPQNDQRRPLAARLVTAWIFGMAGWRCNVQGFGPNASLGFFDLRYTNIRLISAEVKLSGDSK